jgi:hypothetical protein
VKRIFGENKSVLIFLLSASYTGGKAGEGATETIYESLN